MEVLLKYLCDAGRSGSAGFRELFDVISGLLRCGYADREAKCLGVKPVGSAIAAPKSCTSIWPPSGNWSPADGGPCAVARELKLPLNSAHTVVKAVRAEHNRSAVLHCTA